MNVTRCNPPELFRQTTDGLKLRKPTRCMCWADWFQARCHQNLNWEKRTGKSLALTISKLTRPCPNQALWQSARLWNQFDIVAKLCNYNVTWCTGTKAMVKFFWVYKNHNRMNLLIPEFAPLAPVTFAQFGRVTRLNDSSSVGRSPASDAVSTVQTGSCTCSL